MIKIIKPGDDEELKGTKIFVCRKCGCIFKADKEDYRSDSWYNSFYYSCTCPYCNFEYAYEQEWKED